MRVAILIAIVFLAGFVSNEIYADKEMIGFLKITDIYSIEPTPESYLFFFEDAEQNQNYQLNPDTVPPNILDLAGKKIRIVIEDNPMPAGFSLGPQEILFNVVRIEPITIPDGISGLVVPETWRSITLLSKFNDIPTIPSEFAIEFHYPQGIALDSSDNLYVADSDTNGFGHEIQKFNPNGVFLEKFGSLCQLSTTSGCSDPDGGGPLESGDGQFLFPSDVTIDSLGNIIVADNNNNRVQKLDSSGAFVFKIGAFGGNGTFGDGDGEFHFPYGVATDSSNNIYVSDQFNGRIEKFDSSGNFIGWLGACNSGSNCNSGNHTSIGFSCTEATCGIPVNSVGNGQFSSPRGLVIDGSDKIYVADTGNNRVQVFDSSGNFVSKFGSSGSGDGQFSNPRAITTDDSKIYVADTDNNRVQVFNMTGTFQLKFGSLGTSNGQFNSTEGIGVDSEGNIFVGDKNNLRIQKFNSTGSFVSKIDSSPGQSHDSSYYQNLFYDGAVSVDQFYNVSSYGKFDLNGEVNGWNTVTGNQGVLNGDFDTMLTQAIAAHDANVDFCHPSPVTNLILVFNGPVTSIANSAFGSVGNWGGNRAFSDGCNVPITVVWDPDNGGFFCCGQTLDRGIGVTAHEVGHNLGFYHTPLPPGNWRTEFNPIATDPYHDTYSLMSTNRDLESPSTLITAQRDKKGWMDAGNKITVVDGSSATINLDFNNEPEGGVNPQMIIVPFGNGSSYIIEAQKDELFNDTPQDRMGAVVYRHYPGGNQFSYLSLQSDKDAEYSLVLTAGSNTTAQIDQAILELNETYEDVINNVTITTQSVNSTSITVFVSNNAGTCSPPSGNDWIITESCTLTQNVTADKNIIVQNNSVLTIPNGLTVFFDPSTYHITLEFGSGILIQQGGAIKTTPP